MGISKGVAMAIRGTGSQLFLLLYRDLLQQHMETGDLEAVANLCRRCYCPGLMYYLYQRHLKQRAQSLAQ